MDNPSNSFCHTVCSVLKMVALVHFQYGFHPHSLVPIVQPTRIFLHRLQDPVPRLRFPVAQGEIHALRQPFWLVLLYIAQKIREPERAGSAGDSREQIRLVHGINGEESRKGISGQCDISRCAGYSLQYFGQDSMDQLAQIDVRTPGARRVVLGNGRDCPR